MKERQTRRDVLKTAFLAVGAAALGTIGGSVKAFAAGGSGDYPQPPGSPKTHDTFVYNDGPNKGKDVKTTDIVVDAPPISVQAKDAEQTGKARDSEHSTVLLYRVKEDTIPVDWRGDSAGGILAYSAVCTYDATMIEPKDWDAVHKFFVCRDCQTKYDPLQGADVVGGPGKRRLPQVPIADHDGLLRISHGISGCIGNNPARCV